MVSTQELTSRIGRRHPSLVILPLVVAFFVGLFWVTQSAGAEEGEHNDGHCSFRIETTEYRYESGVPAIIETYMFTGRTQWNDSPSSTTNFVAGVSSVPVEFRVRTFDDPDDSNSASWGAGGCAPIGGNYGGTWNTEASMNWNLAKYPNNSTDENKNIAVHEFGHSSGLHHAITSCDGSTPLSVMAFPKTAWACSNPPEYGPYVRDEAAADRVNDRGTFVTRNALFGGSESVTPWQTESDDIVFHGNFKKDPGDDDIDRFGSFDGDKYLENPFNTVLLREGDTLGPPTRRENDFLMGHSNNNKQAYMVGGDIGDIDEDGLASFRAGAWRVRESYDDSEPVSTTFWFGSTNDIPVLGDWDCDGRDTIGVFRPSTGEWFLRNSNSGGSPWKEFFFGNPNDKPMAGNWKPSSCGDEIGVLRGRTWYLKIDFETGVADAQFNWPTSGSTTGMQPMLGDWDENGIDTPGYYK